MQKKIMHLLVVGRNSFVEPYLFTNIITDDVVISQDYEDVFSKQFKRYLVLRDGIDTPSKTDANLIADALINDLYRNS